MQAFIEENFPHAEDGKAQEIAVRQMLAPAMAYLTKQVVKHEIAFKIACASEYLLPHRARELLIRGTPDEASASLATFKVALSLLPVVLKRPDQSMVAFQTARNAEITAILKEVPTYLARATGVAAAFPITEFWTTHAIELPHLTRLFKIVGTLQASSACAERIFSLWQASFGSKDIVDASEEYMEATLMAQANQ